MKTTLLKTTTTEETRSVSAPPPRFNLLCYGISDAGEVFLTADDGFGGIEIQISREQWATITAARESALERESFGRAAASGFRRARAVRR